MKAIDTISKFNQKRIERWIELTKLKEGSDDNTKCPICKDQLYFCSCVKELAQDIMESIFYRKVVVMKIIKGEKYHYDDEFEGKRLVDDVIALETKNSGKVLVYSKKMRANILIFANRLVI